MRMHKNILGGHLLGTSGALLALLLGVMLFPATPEAVHAEETGTKATLTINPVLSLGLDSAVTMSVQPTSTGEFTSGSAELTVSTNNETGYSLYLSTANGKATLDSINPATTTAVQPVSGNVTADRFGANTWGYNLDKDAATDDTTYQAVPTTATAPQATTTGPTLGDGTLAADTYNLNFGALISSDLPSGTYTNTVTVSVVTNPAYLPPFEGIETMQEMTSSICSNADEGETARLKDARDDKLYWVTKLKDGNCWMTQNLDFDIPADGLTSADSDVTSTWDSSSAYPPTATSTTISGNSSNTGTLSWDLGLYIKNNPDDYDSYCNNVKTMSGCNGWTDATNLTPAETEWTGSVDNTVSGNTYDAHFLIGNFYQWNAATAGTGGADVVGEDATDSICPKGWQLPSSRNGGEFDTLVGDLDSTTITQAPYYFNPSGYVSSGSLWYAGRNGNYWSSTVTSYTGGTYYLSFGSSSVNPSNNAGRYLGLSVRCLAR